MTLPSVQLEERHAPSRPFRIASGRRRRPNFGGTNGETKSGQRFLDSSAPRRVRHAGSPDPSGMAFNLPAGADQKLSPGLRGQSPRSLDTEKQVATSETKSPNQPEWKRVTDQETGTPVIVWLKEQETEKDQWIKQLALHKRLLSTVWDIMGRWRAVALGPGVQSEAEAVWFANYQAVQVPREGEQPADAYRRVQKWLKVNKPEGPAAEFLKWERAYFAIGNCGKEWMGYRAACCGADLAVPIGCNHRLCPLCAWHRSQRARVRIKTMFDRLSQPVMITLTIPNPESISKGTFKAFRGAVKAWIEQWDAYIMGGIYSIETTYNRTEKTWHVHAHVLADFSRPLPPRLIEVGGKNKRNLVDFYGARVYAFEALKWRMEFDWLNLTGGGWGKRPANQAPQKSPKAKEKWNAAWERYWENFARWVQAKREHSTEWAKKRYGGKFYLRTDLTAKETGLYERQKAWNRKNTRVFDVRPVDDREGAAKEVLKYITKVADFCDSPDAIEMFCNAVKGARLVQTFGSWYGFDPDTKFDPEHLDDWGKQECSCGCNKWEKIGVFHARDVEMTEAGRWVLKRSVLKHNCRGTVARPRIRGADEPGGEGAEPIWEVR